MIVFFVENLAFCPVLGSTTIIIVSLAALKGLASDFFTACLIKSLKIGSAVFEQVSYFPRGEGSSEPT